MTVEFWMSTLAPVFCITIGKPDILAKAPLSMTLLPVTTLRAALSDTVALRVDWADWVLRVSAPPRCPARRALAAGAGQLDVAGAGVRAGTLSSALAPATTKESRTADRHIAWFMALPW